MESSMNALKVFIFSLFAAFICCGCQKAPALANAEFEWFNLSTNEIWVTDTIGLPNMASPGRLMPSHAEDQLEASGVGFSETVYVKGRITIKWNDNGTNG